MADPAATDSPTGNAGPGDEPVGGGAAGDAAAAPAAGDDAAQRFRAALDRKQARSEAPGRGPAAGGKRMGSTNEKVQRQFRRKSG